MKGSKRALILRSRANYGGYTIIEVIIVLAISSLLLISATAVFNGQQRETDFSQAVQDLSSKFQSYSAQINAGTFPDSDSYSCAISSGRPVLSTTAPGTKGTRESCIFLGRAFQFQQNGNTLYAYTVVGTRNLYSGVTDTGQPATSITQANPEPAKTSLSNYLPAYWVLYDNYKLQGGMTIRSSSAVSGSTTLSGWYMAGFYTGFQATSQTAANTVTNGYTNLMLLGYSLDGVTASPLSDVVQKCIEGTGCTSQPIDQWKLCVQDANSQKAALLTIKGSTSGLTTSTTNVACT